MPVLEKGKGLPVLLVFFLFPTSQARFVRNKSLLICPFRPPGDVLLSLLWNLPRLLCSVIRLASLFYSPSPLQLKQPRCTRTILAPLAFGLSTVFRPFGERNLFPLCRIVDILSYVSFFEHAVSNARWYVGAICWGDTMSSSPPPIFTLDCTNPRSLDAFPPSFLDALAWKCEYLDPWLPRVPLLLCSRGNKCFSHGI